MAENPLLIKDIKGQNREINLKNFWRIDKLDYLEELRPLLPAHINQLLWGIKIAGSDALGEPICRIEVTQQNIIDGDQVIAWYPQLAATKEEGLINANDVAVAAKRIHYEGSHLHFADLQYILPRQLDAVINEERRVIPVVEAHRIPLKRVDIKEIQGSRTELAKVESEWKFWFDMARYFNLSPEFRGMDRSKFLAYAEAKRKILIPFNLGRIAYNFWIKDSDLAGSDGKNLGGSINIMAASVLDKGDKTFPPRVVCYYKIKRTWAAPSLEFRNAQLESYKRSVVEACEVEGFHVKFPFAGGRFSGK